MKSIIRKVRGKRKGKTKVDTLESPSVSFNTSSESSPASSPTSALEAEENKKSHDCQIERPSQDSHSRISFRKKSGRNLQEHSKAGDVQSNKRALRQSKVQDERSQLPSKLRSKQRASRTKSELPSLKGLTGLSDRNAVSSSHMRNKKKKSDNRSVASNRSVLSRRSSRSNRSINSNRSIDSNRSVDSTNRAERVARAAAALDNRGNELFEQGYYDKAMVCYSKALKLKRRTFHSMLEEADDMFDAKIEEDGIEKITDHNLLVSMATSINNIGYLRHRSGEATPDETMKAYKQSLRIKQKVLGNDSLSVGKTLNNIGSVHYLKKEFAAAVETYQHGILIMQFNLGSEHPDVATVLSNMGDSYLKLKNQEEALEHYRKALKVRWNAFGEHDPRVVRLLEKIAKTELGDMMNPGDETQVDETCDLGDSQLLDLDMRQLRTQVGEDMQYFDSLQKQIEIDMVKDKLTILRGMRELMDTPGGSSSTISMSGNIQDSKEQKEKNRNDDEESEPDPQKVKLDRGDAQKHIKDRLAKIRSQRRERGDGNDSISNAGNRSLSRVAKDGLPEKRTSAVFGSQFYTRSQRPALSTLQPDELKGEVNSMRSALRLREGISSLRSLHLEVDRNQTL